MKVLITCHCKKPIYDEDEGFYFSPELVVLSKTSEVVELYYIDYDERCYIEDEYQFKQWASIPSDLKFDIVWMENCPIWGSLFHRNNAKQIFGGAHNVLNASGKILIGMYSTSIGETDEKVNYINEIIKELNSEGKLFTLKIQPKDALPMVLTLKETPKYESRPELFIVITKESAVGGYRRHHTQRRTRTKRQRTKKHNNKTRRQ